MLQQLGLPRGNGTPVRLLLPFPSFPPSNSVIFEVLDYALLLRQYKLSTLHLQYRLYHYLLVCAVHKIFYPKM
jgi:hypothetical protein